MNPINIIIKKFFLKKLKEYFLYEKNKYKKIAPIIKRNEATETG